MLQKRVRKILKENERIDDLQIKNLKIIQNKDGFCFGIDSVLISEFAKDIKKNSKVMDLGTGTGIIGFLLLAKTNIDKVIGVEIQSEVVDMVGRSIKLNDLEDKFEVINCNVKDIPLHVKRESIDVVVTNPPYKKNNTGGKNGNEKKLISRHEILADIFDFIKSAKYVLKDKGSLYIVHRPERLSDIMYGLRENKMEPKKVRFVYSKEDSDEAKLVLIKAVKNGGDFLQVDKPLYIYKKNGEYTDDILKIYSKK